ncbi:DUF6141 family protein [Gynurincola endophyticus]|uniref:DUF6141 family protein n=1 Tax=Gynurincola endophyticus TaxID=2479004 RepID=UPI000F8D02EC|nr:DUF6141 family protein [Gynurincola endophyticus]
MNEIIFTERQRFKQWWIWILLLGVNAFFLYGVFIQLVIGRSFGNKPMNNTTLLIITGLTLLITLLVYNLRLDTIIRNDGIYVRFFPFHFKFKQYTWNTLTKCYIRKYSALLEYGGWGVRIGLSGKAFNVSGNKGLQLELNNKKKILIGTKKPEELAQKLESIAQLKH